MKVKELKEMIKDYDDEKNVVLISYAGLDWRVDEKVEKNPKQTDEQVIIFIR